MGRHNRYTLYDHLWKRNVLVNVLMKDVAHYCKLSANVCYRYHSEGRMIKGRYEIMIYVPEHEEKVSAKKEGVKFYRVSASSGYYPRIWS